jgi:hypothetical protein
VQSVDRVDAGLIGHRSISAGHLFIVTGKEFGVTSLSSVSSKDKYPSEHGSDAIDEFPTVIRGFLKEHRPSRMPFFRHLANLPFSVASDPTLLGRIHLIYQSAMHATRTAVYYLPHLDSPALRKRKLQILIDDDGLPGGDTHHYQLTRAFLNIGAKSVLADEEFGDPQELCGHLDAETLHFVRLARELYGQSLGPWCAVEVLSIDWMRALAKAISVHFPEFVNEPTSGSVSRSGWKSGMRMSRSQLPKSSLRRGRNCSPRHCATQGGWPRRSMVYGFTWTELSRTLGAARGTMVVPKCRKKAF